MLASELSSSHDLFFGASEGGKGDLTENLLNLMSDSFIAMDHHWRILFVNQAYIDFVAPRYKSGADLVGAELWERFPEIVNTDDAAIYRSAMVSRQAVAFETYYARLGAWLHIRVHPIPQGICLYFRDVTAQKQQAASLEDAQVRYRSLFESIDAGFCIIEVMFDNDGSAIDYRFLEVNPAFEAHTGLKNAAGKTMRQLAPDHEDHWFQIYGRVARTGEPIHFENGAGALERWFNVYAFRLGEPTESKVAVLFTDITATKRASVDLERRNELLSLLSESARDLLAATDAKQLVHRLYERVAPKLGIDCFFNFMVDGTADGLVLESCGGVTEETREFFARLSYGQAICGVVAQKGERLIINELQQCQLPMADGVRNIGMKAYACHPLMVGERLIGTLSFGSRVRDKFLEDEVEFMQTLTSYVAMAKERLRVESDHYEALKREQAASQAKDRFLAVLSHELRTPLTPVLMTVAAREDDPDLPPTLREEMSMIRRNVELETKLIDDLLDLSRITSGKLTLKVQPVELNDIIRRVCEICRPQMIEKRIRFERELEPGLGHVNADPARLQQIIWNLLKNAVKFTPDGGSISVATCLSPEGRVQTIVSDTGMGISADLLPRIFDAFEQGNARVTQQFGGMGLGLAITKALVDLHGGNIQVSSDGPGCGAVFVVELPPMTSTPWFAQEAQELQEPRPRTRARLLLVEDHADTARMLAKLLERVGFTVETAGNVADALTLAKHQEFDLLVSDLGLPDGSGYDLVQQFHKIQNIPAIAMSGYGMEDDMRKSRAAGFSQHMVKPITTKQLEQVISELLE